MRRVRTNCWSEGGVVQSAGSTASVVGAMDATILTVGG